MSKTKSHKQKQHQPRARNHTASSSEHAHQHRERGPLLTAAIILVIVHGIILTLVAYYDLTTNGLVVKSLYLPVLVLTSAADVVAGIALWSWKRWGFQLYVAAALVSATAALMNTGYFMVVFATLLPPIIVAYIYMPRQKMFD